MTSPSLDSLPDLLSLDRVGIVVSTLCAAHCALAPFAAALSPLVGFVADERIEWALLIAVILVGVASLLPGLLFRHRDAKPLILFVVGIALLFAARLLSEEEATLELVAIVASATLIASAHLLNLRACRRCPCCERRSTRA